MRLIATGILAFALPLAAVASDIGTVTFNGLGLVQIGMTKTDVSRVVGEPLQRSPGAGDVECEYFYSPNRFAGVKLMFSREHLARIDISEGPIPTAAGIRIGDTIGIIGDRPRFFS